ncbi:hypothetical protein B5M09_004014 [Aphanomyces astaci]|uniref:Phosphatidylinositol-specific phospholipase C X domain-containing protein n=1 Tax=Aphanomyces astaci TaxID=112090 RepID=A0A3R8DQF7_APHAT|nr:hypothetical protein B5M09_004014 [Aphanomyces astaci]
MKDTQVAAFAAALLGASTASHHWTTSADNTTDVNNFVTSPVSHFTSYPDLPRPGYDRSNDPDLLPDVETPFVIDLNPLVAKAGGCNGFAQYCNKRVDQVLWIGAHNSLTDVGLAVQRNQFVNGPRLMDAGVRYFDIDSCAFDEKGKRVAPYVCHGQVKLLAQWYQSTETGLTLIRDWLVANPREVVFLNFGDVNDFSAVNAKKEATSTVQLRDEIASVVRSVFQDMAVLRNDPWDAQIKAGNATLQQLIDANRRVVVSIGKASDPSPTYWGQDDRVCNDVWYDDSLQADWIHNNYKWTPVLDFVETRMRQPCAAQPGVLNKLEFVFHTALGGTIDSHHVGDTLSTYMEALKTENDASPSIRRSPYFPFNLVLTDHSDKWRELYPQWHNNHLTFLGH